MSNKFRLLSQVVFAAGIMVAVSHSAEALLIRSSQTTDLTTGVRTTSTIDDGGTGDTSMGVNGIITLNSTTQPLPGVVINGSDQESEGTPVNPGAFDILSSGSSSSINKSADTIRRIGSVSATDFAAQAVQLMATASGTFVNAPGATITLKWWEDSTNTQGATTVLDTPGILIANYTFTTTTGNESFSYNSDPISINNSNPFSMTLQFDYTLPSGGSLISRGQAEQAPTMAVDVSEPTTLVMFGLALLGLGIAHRRTRF